MRVAACLVLLALCLGLAGCRIFGKKTAAATNPPDQPAANAAPGARADTGIANLAATDRQGSPAGIDGLLAGRVLDSYNARPPAAFIQVVSLDEVKETATAAPIEVATDGQGYFTIQGLNPGRHYKLVARVKEAGRMLAGITYAMPPDPKVVIRISEDYASPTTPAVPAEPTYPGTKLPIEPKGGAKGPPATLERPSSVQPGAASSQVAPTPPPRMESVVNVPGPSTTGPEGSPAITGPFSTPPSCKVANNRLEKLVLNDLDGQPWEYPRSQHGRLILLDFWGTWCSYCVRAIPELRSIQTRYGSYGLDVIGIAYEEDGAPQDQARRVKGLRDRMGINYRMLLGSDMKNCPVKTQFDARRFPTLILLDEQGNIVWRSEGLDAEKRLQLEGELRWRLGLR